MSAQPVLLFDLDGTLIDSTYHHVQSWRAVFVQNRIEVPSWKIHSMIGISGSRLLEKLLRGAGCEFNDGLIKVLEDCHEKIYRSVGAETQAFPRARELLETLSEKRIPWAIATTGKLESVKKDLDALGIHPDSSAVITRDSVSDGKPQPDVFIKAAQTLGVSMDRCIVVGDSIWDMLAAARGRASAVGMLCGGTSPEALSRAGAICLYEGPGELLDNLADIIAA